MGLRTCIEIHFTGDSRKTPEVLVFKVRTVAPTHHLHGNQVLLARREILRQVEFRRHLAVFAVSHEFAVHPYHQVGRSRTHVQVNPLTFPIGRHGHHLTVRPRIIVTLFHERRFGSELCSPWITIVAVNGISVTIQLQDAGHGKVRPLRIVVLQGIEVARSFVVVLGEIEFPLAFQ